MAFTIFNNQADTRNFKSATTSVKTSACPSADASNVSFLNDTNTKKRWLCNVSEGVKLSKGVKHGLNISSNGRLSQYELIVKLLKAENCDVIYFDCHLSASQIGILKMLQVFSSTELVHARLAMQFDRAMG